MARRKNKRRFDPRYFMSERTETTNERIFNFPDKEEEEEEEEPPEFELDPVEKALFDPEGLPKVPEEQRGWWEDEQWAGREELPGEESIDATDEFVYPGEERLPAGVASYLDRLKNVEDEGERAPFYGKKERSVSEDRNLSMKDIVTNFSFDNFPAINEVDPGEFDPDGTDEKDEETEEIGGEDEETEEADLTET